MAVGQGAEPADRTSPSAAHCHAAMRVVRPVTCARRTGQSVRGHAHCRHSCDTARIRRSRRLRSRVSFTLRYDRWSLLSRGIRRYVRLIDVRRRCSDSPRLGLSVRCAACGGCWLGPGQTVAARSGHHGCGNGDRTPARVGVTNRGYPAFFRPGSSARSGISRSAPRCRGSPTDTDGGSHCSAFSYA